MKSRTLILAAFVWSILQLTTAMAQDAKVIKPAKVGEMAPDFSLPGKPKQVVKLSDYRTGSKNKKTAGKNVVVVFCSCLLVTVLHQATRSVAKKS